MDKNRELELKYFARQYDKFHNIHPDCARMQRNAEKARQIEKAAETASTALYPWIMENVTKGKTFEQMRVPCGRVQFYRARSRFFNELDTLHN